MTTSIVPSFNENRETNSILASSTVHMMEEIPDTQKYYQLQDATSLTENGCNIQSTNLNDWIAGELEVIATRTFTFTGRTIQPNVDGYGTQPYLWNPRNSSVDPFCINKTIRELKISVANKNFTNPDRLPEMIDIYSTQFDIDCLKSYGINGDGVKNKFIEHNSNQAFGSSLDSLVNLTTGYSDGVTALATSGFMKNNYINETTQQSATYKQNTKGYVKVKSVKFYKGVGLTALSTSYTQSGYEGIAVPLDENSLFYSVVPAEVGPPPVPAVNELLTQVVELEIHEFIIDPNFSNPYSKNKNLKTYYAGGYPFNLQFVFNQDYMQSLLKWMPDRRGTTTGSNQPLNTPVLAPVLASSKWSTFKVGFWTFNTAKPLPSGPIKTIYYKENRQSIVQKPLTFNVAGPKDSTTGDVSISTANLSSLPPYIIVYGGVSPGTNANYFSSGTPATNVRTNTPYIEMANIDYLKIRIGTQGDALAGIDVEKEELVNHTLSVLGNKEYRQMLMSDLSYLNYDDWGQYDGLVENPPVLANYTQVAPRNAYNRAWNFYIIDVAKLNIRNDGVPILPSINYGSQAYKSITITAQFSMTRNMWDVLSPADNKNLVCEMNVVLLDKYVRTLPLLSGNMTDDPIEYQLSDVSSALMAQIQSPYSGDGQQQLAYVGGSFFGSLMGHINNIRNHPLVKTIGKIANTVHNVANAVSGGKNDPYSRI